MDDDELTEEREVGVLEHRHLPERLQQLSTGARVSRRRRSEGWPMSGVEVKPTNKFMVGRGREGAELLRYVRSWRGAPGGGGRRPGGAWRRARSRRRPPRGPVEPATRTAR